jgi:hypothetical protein
MSENTCPHCHGSVPYGAKVCRGCQAEVEYGTPPAAIIALAILLAFIGYKISAILPNALSFMGWIVGIGGFVAGCLLLAKTFEKRVIFKRIYRTK